MSATTLVDDRTAPEGHASILAAGGTAAPTGTVPRAEEPPPAVARVRFAALTARLLMVLGALAVVTAYVLLPLAAALRAGAVMGGVALALAAVIVAEAALAVALIVLKTQARH